MFDNKLISQTTQIIKGTVNNLLSREEILHKKRIVICKECGLYNKDGVFGPECNNKIFLNPITNEISNIPKSGFYKGCSCVLSSATRVIDKKCPVGKW